MEKRKQINVALVIAFGRSANRRSRRRYRPPRLGHAPHHDPTTCARTEPPENVLAGLADGTGWEEDNLL